MRLSRAARAAAERAAVELDLDELLSMRLSRVRGPFAAGRRLPVGERVGKGRAKSLNFDGISPYAPGDDVRLIDWRASARTGETLVRRFAAETHRARMIVLDLRPELYFGVKERLIAKTAALTAARLAWEAAALHEPVGLVAPGVETMRPKRGRRNLLRVLDAVKLSYDRPRRGEVAPLSAALAEAADHVGRRDEIFAIGDFESPDQSLDSMAKAIAARCHLTGVVVEDRALRSGASSGRYPSLGDHGERNVFDIGRGDVARAMDVAERRRTALRSRLRDVGFEVRDALEMLPSRRSATG